MEIQIIKSGCSSGYETFSGFIDNTIPFRVGRHNVKENYFEEDLKGNLNDDQVMRIFKEINSLRKQKKLL